MTYGCFFPEFIITVILKNGSINWVLKNHETEEMSIQLKFKF